MIDAASAAPNGFAAGVMATYTHYPPSAAALPGRRNDRISPAVGSTISRVRYRELAPHPALRNHVKCMWVLDHDYRDSAHKHEHLWADAHVEVIFTSGCRYFVRRGSRCVSLPASFVIGPFQSELKLFSRGRTALVAARFWPWGFHALSKLPMAQLKNTVRSCREAFGGHADALANELAALRDPDAKIAALEHNLVKLAAHSKATMLARPLAMEILEARGVMLISDLRDKHRIHARRLERLFNREIGVSAKMFARIVRFNHAMRGIQNNPNADLLSLTHECGYSDQAHFARSFREMFGMTPTEFKLRMQRAVARVAEAKQDVVFLQDRAGERRYPGRKNERLRAG